MLSRNWSVKAEYLYMDLGNTTDTFSTFYTSGTPATGQAGVRTVTHFAKTSSASD
jgi:hypothetical protein